MSGNFAPNNLETQWHKFYSLRCHYLCPLASGFWAEVKTHVWLKTTQFKVLLLHTKVSKVHFFCWPLLVYWTAFLVVEFSPFRGKKRPSSGCTCIIFSPFPYKESKSYSFCTKMNLNCTRKQKYFLGLLFIFYYTFNNRCPSNQNMFHLFFIFQHLS